MTAGPDRVTWLGHSTVLIGVNGAKLLTDPLLRRRVVHLRRIAPPAAGALDVDAVLVSHVHWDHLHLPSLDVLRRDVLFVVPRGAGRLVRRRRFSEIVELSSGEAVTVAGVEIRATEAAHRVQTWVRGSAPALGFLVQATHSIYFAGDTDLFDGMSSLAPRLDVALLPVAGWGPRLPPGHLDPERAARALCLLRPAVAVPIHWGTYRPIQMRPRTDGAAAPHEFRRLAAELAPSVDVRILQVGESTDLT